MHDWLIKIILVLIGGGLINLLEWLIYRRLLPRFEKRNRVWRKAFLKAWHRPFQIFIWVIIGSFIISILAQWLAFNGQIVDALSTIRRIVVVAFIYWFAIRFIRDLENGMVMRAAEGAGKINDPTTVHAMAQFSRVLLIIITLLVMLQSMGIKISALLAFGGVGALAIGLAAKDNIANFIGGMMIYWDRPFSVGDWIRLPNNDIEGTVENIGWRLTRIRTFDKRPLYMPNGVLSNVAVENPSRMTNRRIKVSVGVRYDDASKIAPIAKGIEEMLRNHPEIDTNQTLFVYLYDFAPSSLNILVYTFTKTTQWVKFQSIQQDVFLKIIDIIAQHGAECAYPTTTVHVPEGLKIAENIRQDADEQHS